MEIWLRILVPERREVPRESATDVTRADDLDLHVYCPPVELSIALLFG